MVLIFLFFKYSNGNYYLIETGEKCAKHNALVSQGIVKKNSDSSSNSSFDDKDVLDNWVDYNVQFDNPFKTLKKIVLQLEKNPGNHP